MSLSRKSQSTFVLLIGILAVSTASIFIRFAQEEAPSLVIAAYRLVFASLILTPFALPSRLGELRSMTRAEVLLALGAGLFLAIHFATWITSLRYTSVLSSLVIVQTSPIWVALAAPFFLKEELSGRAAAGLGFAVAGGLVVSFGDRCGPGTLASCPQGFVFYAQSLLGNFLALAGAWSSAGYLIIGRQLRPRLSLVGYIYIVYSSAAAFLVIMLFTFGHAPTGYPAQTYLWFLLLALIPQLLGHSSFNWALAYLPASFVAVTLLGEPVGSAVLAGILLEEIPGPLTLAGAALILFGIYLTARRS
ncbi:MAG TPA: DMT family transporter [Anaerolineales bacterium]|nr:DMT family transporter [Anaerolineales bacterium]